ncbi:ATP-binding protein [Calothrix sp. PCC 6303]|uniref:PAS domain-containing sensor histidine kinase n=1 Tax=Calothrix sp. PCC 6303 TaxID=1170562 RepID=UPI0002A04692|nr:ATP-binding protein [Calothrix sp. PCC 6303]AFZ00610.1 histidine kinase [Calothrix sp. PCC 6303]
MSDSDYQIKQLRSTLSKMEIALSTVEECIVWTDRQGRIKWCNAALERFFDKTRLLLLGNSLVDKLPLLIDGKLLSANLHPVTIALETRKSGKECYEFEKSKQFIILEIAWSFVEITSDLTETDDSASSVLVLRDVTQQREAKRRLEEVNKGLEQQVAKRTQELSEANTKLQMEAEQLQKLLTELQQTQAQLIHTEKMSSLGQLVAGIAHEINNPVNFISGNLAYLQEYICDLLNFVKLYQKYYPNPVLEIEKVANKIDIEFLQTDFPKILRSMEMGTERITQIVLSLRNFSRMDEAEIKAVDIHEGIDSTLLILQHRLKLTAESSEIKVIRDYNQLPLVECYTGQLNQVFMNILANAIDAIEELNAKWTYQEIKNHSSQITIRTSVVDSQWVEVVIADNGTGIPEAIQQHIFNPFFTTKPVGKGTGMGMAISYKIITKNHGGKLTCFSVPGKGTQFTIQIPTKIIREDDNP